MKKLISLLCAAALCLLMPVAAFAAETPAPNPEAVQQETAASPKANSFYCYIGMASNYSIAMSATASSNDSSSITVTCQLQRKVNGVWYDYGSPVSKSGKKSVIAATTVAVSKGYTYRVKAYSSLHGTIFSRELSM